MLFRSTAELARLKNLSRQYAGTEAGAGFDAQIAFVIADLLQQGFEVTENQDGSVTVDADVYVDVIIVNDIWAQSSNITVTSKSFVGSGNLYAPGDAEIKISNASPAYLRINRLTIPETDGGNLYFNGVKMNAASTAASNALINGNQTVVATFTTIVTSATSTAPAIIINSNNSLKPDIT